MVSVYDCTDPDEELDCDVNEEFDDNIKNAHLINFPILKNSDWDERLEKELTEAYKKYGYKKSETYDVSPYDDNPACTNYLCFVKLKK